MRISSVVMALALLFATAVQAGKYHAAIWRFENKTKCEFENSIQGAFQYMTPGGCHSPKGEGKFNEVYVDYAQETGDDYKDPESYGYCQLNAYSEPHCQGETVMEYGYANMKKYLGKCVPVNEGKYAVSLQLKCSKSGFVDMAGDE